jgi:hypothetical protein
MPMRIRILLDMAATAMVHNPVNFVTAARASAWA